MTNEDSAKSAHRSYLFMVRLWPEELSDTQTEWRGQVQHILSGEIHYFRDWATLVEVMTAMVTELEGNDPSARGD